MNPSTFAEQTAVHGANQPQYRPLPSHTDSLGIVTTKWKFTIKERIKVLVSGELWLQQMTHGNSLQPQLPSVDKPVLLD